MDDLLVAPGPGAPHGIRVPAIELIEQFSRASGSGGQGVNTTDSRVQLSIDLATTSALDEIQRERVMDRLSTHLAGTVLTITASEHRSQRQNRVAARQRLAGLLREAVTPASPRRASRPTNGSADGGSTRNDAAPSSRRGEGGRTPPAETVGLSSPIL